VVRVVWFHSRLEEVRHFVVDARQDVHQVVRGMVPAKHLTEHLDEHRAMLATERKEPYSNIAQLTLPSDGTHNRFTALFPELSGW